MLIKVHVTHADRWSEEDCTQYTNELKGISDTANNENARQINASQKVSCEVQKLLLTLISVHTGGRVSQA